MKFFPLVLAAGLTVSIAVAQDSPALVQARQQLEKIRGEVRDGLTPASKLTEQQKAVDDATDDAILDRTLYGHVEIQDLTEAQASDMIAAAERRVARTQAEVDRGTRLIAEGVAPKEYSADALAELTRRQEVLKLARDRAELLSEIAAVVNAEIEATQHKPAQGGSKLAKEYVDGSHGLLTDQDIKDLTLAFEKKFDKPLPISARGETALHRSLGMDHTGRIDVAVTPDSDEGVWLRKYLESKDIPFYAFRIAIPGKATGAHIHIGPGSTRLQTGA